MASSLNFPPPAQVFTTPTHHGIKVSERLVARVLATKTDLTPTQRSHARMAQASTSQLASPRTSISSSPPALTPVREPPRSALVLPRLSPSIRTRTRPQDNAMPLLHHPIGLNTLGQRQPPVVDLTGEDDEQEVLVQTAGQPRQRSHPIYSDNVIDLSGDSPELHTSTLRRRPSEEQRRSPEERRTTWDPNRRLPSLIREPSSVDARGDGHIMGAHRSRQSMFGHLPTPPRQPAAAPIEIESEPQSYDLTVDDDLEYLGQTTHPAVRDTPVLVSSRTLPRPTDTGLASYIGRWASSNLQMPSWPFPGISNIMAAAAAESRIRRGGPLLPSNLDYVRTGFEVMRHAHPRQPSPMPKIDPPPPAEDGFTRSPLSGEEVVCPCCGGELTTGETDEKRQVWVVKGCGHVSLVFAFWSVVQR